MNESIRQLQDTSKREIMQRCGGHGCKQKTPVDMCKVKSEDVVEVVESGGCQDGWVA
jgi:hypothetical protein